MQGLDYWRLCDELSIIQAALLIAGSDPSIDQHSVERCEPEKRPAGYEAAKSAISNAVKRGDIEGKVVFCEGREFEPLAEIYYTVTTDRVDIESTIVLVQSLKEFLKKRGVSSGFFFPTDEPHELAFLNSNHPYYSPKLAAATEAWLAVSKSLKPGKTVKQSILVWLRSNAGRFGLIKDDGNPNENGIEEVAKVANWDTKGGAPKTPDTIPTPPTRSAPSKD